MSIASEITRINTAVADAYAVVEAMGGALPDKCNVAGMADAIDSIEVFSSAQFTANGERDDYSYAFANTGYKRLPISEITAKDIKYMLANCQELTTAENLTVTVNNSNPSATYVCANCANMKVAPTFIFNNAVGTAPVSACKTWTNAFLNCAAMTTCSIYLGDGTQNPLSVRNTMQNAFKNCINLENLTFTGYGSPMSLDLSDCVKLSRVSLLSLKAALMDVSAATSGNYTITLSAASKSLLNTAELEAVAALGWTIKEM